MPRFRRKLRWLRAGSAGRRQRCSPRRTGVHHYHPSWYAVDLSHWSAAADDDRPPRTGRTVTPGLVLYTSPDGSARLQLRIEHKTLWLTQAQMASIFQTTKQNISLHI